MGVPAKRSAPPRWRLRFTLRVLLAGLTAVAIVLGVWTHRARAQRQAVEQIEAGGGAVCYERDGPDAPENRGLVIEWLAGHMGRDYFEGVTTATVRDRRSAALVHHLRGLASLSIQNGEVGDDDLSQLARSRSLQTLEIMGRDRRDFLPSVAPFGDGTIAQIAQLQELQTATLWGRNITDQGLRRLAECKKLESLNFASSHSSIDAADFEPLRTAGRIQSLAGWRGAESADCQQIARW